MKSKRKTKKIKGMTLVEIIISLAVFAMLGVIMATVSGFIHNTMLAANDLNGKVAHEAPIAENQNVANATNSGAVDIKISINGKQEILPGQYYETTYPDGDDSAINADLNLDFIIIDPAVAPTTVATP